MTTTITEGEIRLIYIQIIMMAVMGVFVALWSLSPIIDLSAPAEGSYTESGSFEAEDASWISGLMSLNAGLPIGTAELLIVSSIVLIPLTIMNSFVVIRFIKDMATGWL